VKVTEEDQVQTFPEVLFRQPWPSNCLRSRLLFSRCSSMRRWKALPTRRTRPTGQGAVVISRPARMLHYFPPVVAGVLVPTLLILSLVVIPYFNVNIEANGLFLKDHAKRVRLSTSRRWDADLSSCFPCLRRSWAHGDRCVGNDRAAYSTPDSPSRLRRYLALKRWLTGS